MERQVDPVNPPVDLHVGGPEVRAVAMPADTNPNGDVFGGWVLGQMDLAGALAAARRAQGRIATVGIEAMAFHQPVCVGDVLSCYATILKVGRTSIRIRVDAWVRRWLTLDVARVTEGEFSYVAIDENRRPRLVPREDDPGGGSEHTA